MKYEDDATPVNGGKKILYDTAPVRGILTLIDLTFTYLLWLVFCIPVITIGASTASMYHVMIRIVKGEEYKVWRDFWAEMKENFKTKTLLWLSIVALYAFLLLDLEICNLNPMPILNMVTYLIYAVMVFAFFFICMIFPLQGRYGGGYVETIRSAITVSTHHFMLTLVVAALPLVPILAPYYTTNMNVIALILVVGVPLILVLQSYLLSRMFKQIEESEEA